MLRQAGADGWDSLFVSNSIGIRKDSGQLYDHLNDHYKIHPDEFLMIGDNERSDVQIPSDRGSHLVHFLRPTEIARGTPRLGPLVNLLEKRADLDEELTFGSVLLHNFSPIAYPEFDPSSLFSVTPENVGYSLVGPLLVSFSQWLLEKSRDDTVDRLYFLSREGKLMKEVYDAWTIDKPDAPQSEYLVISRRCSSLAALTSFEDILEIARVTYFPNTLERLLSTRFGIRLSQEKWGQISDALSVDSNSKIEIKDKKIGNLEGVLHLLQGDIYHQAQRERRGLVQRLKELNIQEVNKPAVVDIGYGGSVQGHLNKVLGKQINGYYLLTDDRSCHVADRYDVIIRGCFGENINGRMQAPFMFRNSFEVEKLLSSNEPQIEFYEIENGKAVGRYRPLVPAEIQPANIRNQIHAGAVKYAQDLREIQRTLLPDFRPSVFVATSLMDAFFTNTSEAEKSLLTSIVLADYYCGRDLVA
jgi:predicted HAD superfamily hydrolase